ncbi:MAG: UMP kinase [Candidatus Thermoplasmatota archaeon]|nr:UMP kinase [Candidatus Thermoplasmatota archaeon]
MNLAISIGGSVLGELNLKYLKELASVLTELSSKHRLWVVVGGGEIARKYISVGRELGCDESYLDSIGIDITRANAKVLLGALPQAYPEIPENLDSALTAGKLYKIVVMGGTHPGHTTDAVAATLAERAKASKLIIMTDVDGVYTADPRKHKDAKLSLKLSYEKLLEVTSKTSLGAGSKSVIDPIAARIIARSKIPTFVINGRNLKNLENLIGGKAFIGTTIE